MATEHFVTDDALSTKLQVVLQTWPLYRTFVYTGADRVDVAPRYLSLFCDHCKKETFWEAPAYGYGDRSGFSSKKYNCRNCGHEAVTYYFFWQKGENNSVFFKVGQYPELEERVSTALEDALPSEDLKLYKNALRLRNFNLGIAAVAYMRRVVENRINDMLEILHEAARAHNAPAELLGQFEKVKKEKRFSVKVDYAGDLLPLSLRPAGHANPMAVLHELASDGLHTKSDEECVDIFDECRRTFEYVFGKMRIEAEEARAFVKGMTKLAEKRAKADKPDKPSTANSP